MDNTPASPMLSLFPSGSGGPINIYLQCGVQGPTLDQIAALINQLKDLIMATLADLQSAVTAEDTVIDSAVTLINGLAAQIAALKPNQAAIDSLAADVKARAASLSAAVAANTPTPPALATSFAGPATASQPAFDAASSAYTGPEEVDLNSVAVKAGTTPALAYFTHSSDGRIDMVGPSD